VRVVSKHDGDSIRGISPSAKISTGNWSQCQILEMSAVLNVKSNTSIVCPQFRGCANNHATVGPSEKGDALQGQVRRRGGVGDFAMR
jgi:hypothetical protein